MCISTYDTYIHTHLVLSTSAFSWCLSCCTTASRSTTMAEFLDMEKFTRILCLFVFVYCLLFVCVFVLFVCLFCLARECGWPQKAVSDAVREICGVLAKHAPDYIVLPDEQELANIAASIESWGNSRLPNCVGAVDGTHVPVQSSDRSYQNSKKYSMYKSLNFQVYVDDAGFIRNVSGGQPGCVHDSDLFVNSLLYDYVKWLSELGHKFIHGITVGYYCWRRWIRSEHPRFANKNTHTLEDLTPQAFEELRAGCQVLESEKRIDWWRRPSSIRHVYNF